MFQQFLKKFNSKIKAKSKSLMKNKSKILISGAVVIISAILALLISKHYVPATPANVATFQKNFGLNISDKQPYKVINIINRTDIAFTYEDSSFQ